MTVSILIGDVREQLRTLASDSIHCCVTSPPYWGLRDYGVDGQIGLEASPAEFIAVMVEVFEEVRRVLRPDGTCWINMGDSYAANRSYQVPSTLMNGDATNQAQAGSGRGMKAASFGLKPKDLCMMPHRLAIALQDAGWWVRQDIVWSKPNPMPESVRDRCTKAHEYIFLLTKSEQYFFDQAAIAEPVAGSSIARLSQDVENQAGSNRVPGKTNGPMKAVGTGVGFGHGTDKEQRARGRHLPGNKTHKGTQAYEAGDDKHRTKAGLVAYAERLRKALPDTQANLGEYRDAQRVVNALPETRNKRSVWTITTQPYKEAHFATFPPELPETCIKAGCPAGGTVLDPFFGAGTTGLVADRLQRDCIGIELNPAYAEIARKRIQGESTLFADVRVAA